jgi:hypothetical protein
MYKSAWVGPLHGSREVKVSVHKDKTFTHHLLPGPLPLDKLGQKSVSNCSLRNWHSSTRKGNKKMTFNQLTTIYFAHILALCKQQTSLDLFWMPIEQAQA